eukprot:TRINITY_DN28112_c0_g1_i1.p1 TRINITY_DN28112_c0_g1~~TRINITY_DN28112_c0_g1_i1.p1  ORF type:complete len:323 (-),score=41.11 TRINITY_DN28112_c0_g1_i1:417-1325(-)
MVMELCHFSLLDVMRSNLSLIEHDVQRMFAEMLTGIAHCHSLRIVHCDVKPDNFMLGGSEGTTLKLCDFGLAQALDEGYLKGICGTAPYMAPEIVWKEPYDEKVDVWSFGVVAYVLLFGCFPYKPKLRGSTAMKAAICVGLPEPFFSTDERGDFTRMFLERSKKQRCSASEALNFAFLKPQVSTQAAWACEIESAALEASAANKDALTSINLDAQHRLNQVLEGLQQKHNEKHNKITTKKFATSSRPTLLPVSKALGTNAHLDATKHCSLAVAARARSRRKQKSHDRFLSAVHGQLINAVNE